MNSKRRHDNEERGGILPRLCFWVLAMAVPLGLALLLAPRQLSGISQASNWQPKGVIDLRSYFSAVIIFAGIAQRCHKIAALLTGAIPFCVLGCWLNKVGSDLLQMLGWGAWLSLACGLALLILPPCLKRNPPTL